MKLLNKKIHRPSILILFLLFLTACNMPMPDLDLEPEVNKLFSALQAEDYDTMLPMYSDKFYKSIEREHWRLSLKQFSEHMGPMESYRIRYKQADTKFSGKFFVFQMETRHEGQKKARHVLTFVLPFDGGDVGLVAHKITAKGL